MRWAVAAGVLLLPATFPVASASFMRSRTASAEKPPKTTLWVAPIRAQASMAMAASGIMGK